ncbi:SH2 domain-containing protein 5 [Aplochiton taeniatus]
MGEASIKDDTVTRSAEYVGSFPVDDCCLDEQIEQLHIKLKCLTSCKRRRSVSLKFSTKGVKMYDEDETTLLMAHALRRVSLTTSRLLDAQFAFVSHNPGCPDAQLYCHLFKARHARAAQVLNLLLCRCFQLAYLEKHPEEEAEEECVGPLPRRMPSLLNHGFPLSVSALVSFRRAPTGGLLPGAKVFSKSFDDRQISPEETFTSCPSLVRKKVIRNKVLRSGAYRSFTLSSHKQRSVDERLNSPQGKAQDRVPVRRVCAPSLAETEEALAQAVWCWADVAVNSSIALLAEDVLGSYLLCPHPKRPSCGSLMIRFPSGLVTLLINNTTNQRYKLEKSKSEFSSMADLIEYYTKSREDLPCPLSCARVNHCYEWEEASQPEATGLQKRSNRSIAKKVTKKLWV